MPYIGNTAADRFVASKAATQFSGDGSTTAFTLEHSVGADEDILVSVDGVVQEPSVAYAVSNGTTLTFTAAPSSNSGNNIFVYYLFRTIGTVSHPSNNALSASTGTFTGDLTVDTSTLKVDSTNNRVGVGTASPSNLLHIQKASSGGTPNSNAVLVVEGTDASKAHIQLLCDNSDVQSILFGDAADNDIGKVAYDHTGNSMRFTVNAAECMRIDSTGAITKPNQPAFLATKSSVQSNIAINSLVQITFDGERFDQNGDFSSSTFTAPVTGKYQFNVVTALAELDQDSAYVEFKLETSNVTYTNPIVDPDGFDQDLPYFTISTSYLVDMDANDTAKATLYIPNGSAQTDVRGGQSFFSGYLVA